MRRPLPAALVASLLVLTLSCSQPRENTVELTLQCAQLYDLKKQRYWGHEVGEDRYIFSRDLGTCLALNIYYDRQTEGYFATVIDMSNDKILLRYGDTVKGVIVDGGETTKCESRAMNLSYTMKGTEVQEAGCDRNDLMGKMFEQVRLFGFNPRG
jgi:hypothetical protein